MSIEIRIRRHESVQSRDTSGSISELTTIDITCYVVFRVHISQLVASRICIIHVCQKEGLAWSDLVIDSEIRRNKLIR